MIEPPVAVPGAKISDRPVALYVGTSRPYKNVEVLLRCAQLLPGWDFALRTDRRLQHVAACLGLDNVYFVDDCTPKQLNFLYEACDVYVSASGCEGFGLPLVEASSHGKPVVCQALHSIDFPVTTVATGPESRSHGYPVPDPAILAGVIEHARGQHPDPSWTREFHVDAVIHDYWMPLVMPWKAPKKEER